MPRQGIHSFPQINKLENGIDLVHPTNIRCLLKVKVDFTTPALPTSALSIKK